MYKQNFFRAEQLLVEIIGLDTLSHEADNLAEDQTTLAKVQTAKGNFTSAIGNYIEAWKYFRQMGDRTTEVQIMNAIGDLYTMLGDHNQAVEFYSDALAICRLFKETSAEPLARANLGLSLVRARKYDKAIEHFTAALKILNQQRDTSGVLRLLSLIGRTAAARHDREEAVAAFERAERVVSSIENPLTRAQFFFDYGKMYQLLGDWSSAAQHYRLALGSLRTVPVMQGDERYAKLTMFVYASLGSVLSRNYAYPAAKEQYIEAYTIAKSINDKVALGYLLLSVADCERKIATLRPTQDALINAGTYYEQALTLFSRIGSTTGEALATCRLASLKEEQGDYEAAIKHFTHAFELCDSHFGEFSFGEEYDVLLESHGIPPSQEFPLANQSLWYESLAALLAHQGRVEEAFWYFEKGKARSLWAELQSFGFEFRDPNLQQSFVTYEQLLREISSAESELSFQRSLDTRFRDGQAIGNLQRRIFQRKKELFTYTTSLIQKYPRLELLFKTPSLQSSEIISALQPHSTVLDYLITENRIIIFVFSALTKSAEAIEVPGYRDILFDKIRTYELMLREHIHTLGTGFVRTTDLDRISQELYSYFIRPVERYIGQRVIIIPPPGMDRFPFHALLGETRIGSKPIGTTVDVSYLPHLAAIKSIRNSPRYISSVVALGNPGGKQWSLDYELRDIRSFFKGAAVFVGPNATEKQLSDSFGDVLQLSTEFYTDTLALAQSTFVLSSGSITSPGEEIPISDFLRIHPFSVVYLSDQQHAAVGITPLHIALLLMNGTSHVFATMLPSEQKANKFFSERLYSAFAANETPNEAFHDAVLSLSSQQEFSAPYQWAQFFKYGK